MTRTVEDAALLYAAMRGEPAGELTPAANGQRFTFGVPRPYFTDVLDGTVRAAFEETVAALRGGGHTVVDLEIEHAAWTPDVYLHIVLPEASWYHAPVMDRDPSGYSPGVRLRLEMGRYVLAEDYVRAMDMRKVLTREVDGALARCDGLLLPALAITAPPLHAATVDVDGTPQPVRAVMLRLTQLFNITGHPAVALPAPDAGRDSWPTGVQVVGPAHDTARAIALARAVEAQISGAGSVGGGTG
jgi:aspartyl-tRNA(Asn)/glutamyl-tRNA(Gln) amidotransferase subunit A